MAMSPLVISSNHIKLVYGFVIYCRLNAPLDSTEWPEITHIRGGPKSKHCQMIKNVFNLIKA